MNKDFKQELQNILTNKSSDLIQAWVKLFDTDEEKDIQHRYYDDFLGFFEECIESNLYVDSEEYNATVSFLIKLSTIMGHDKFFQFRHCHYLAYLSAPIIEQLEGSEFFTANYIKKINIFFDSIASRIMLDIINDKNNFEEASSIELEEREAPLSEIWDGVLMVTIVGTLDSNRILKIIDKVLDRLETGDITNVIVDISTIFDMNSEVANQILKLNNAVKFMGVDAYLTGISKNIAKSLTHLDISLGDIRTFSKTKLALSSIVESK